MTDVTRILNQVERGDPTAAEALLPLVYEELRKLAQTKLASQKPGNTLQPTALVHEAYLRLVDVERVQHWNSRGHFFGAAAKAMRRILVDNARQNRSLKRGGDRQRVSLEFATHSPNVPHEDLLALDEALYKLRSEDPIKADLVQLRYFAGLTVEQAAQALGISRATAARYWSYARTWLYVAICGDDSEALHTE